MMNVLDRVLIDVFGSLALVGAIVGFISYLLLFRQALSAGRKLVDLYFFGVYEYAFKDKKGSRETRWMVIGFGTMLGSGLVLMLVGLFSSRH